MSDYTQIGYDEFLTKQLTDKISEIDPQAFEQFTTSITGERITTEIEGDLITTGINASNITTGEMSFDRARGGNLILGGQNNQYGEFALRDEGDTDKITMNKDGIIITGGAINIKDKDDKIMIDANGLVSTTNFSHYSIQDSTTRSKNVDDADSGSFTIIPVTSINFNLTRNTNVLFMVYLQMYLGIGAAERLGLVFGLNLDGTLQPHSTIGWGVGIFNNNTWNAAGNPIYSNFSAHCILTVGPGHHTAAISWKKYLPFGDDITYSINNSYHSAILLGT